MNDPSQYPAGTMLSEMLIDILVNKGSGEVTILHDKPFTDQLLGMEFDSIENDLLFMFEKGPKSFGMLLQQNIADVITASSEITLLQIDIKTEKPIAGITVPLTIKEA